MSKTARYIIFILVIMLVGTSISLVNATYNAHTKCTRAITEKQAELTVKFDQQQQELKAELTINEGLMEKYTEFKEADALNDTEMIQVDSLIAEIQQSNQSILQRRVSLTNLRFAYAILQEMK